MAVSILKQLFTSFYTTEITQIKENLLDKISSIKHTLLNQNDSTIVESFFFCIQRSQWWRECMDNWINNRKHCNGRKVHGSTNMNPFMQSATSLEHSNRFWATLCDIFQLFSWSKSLYTRSVIFMLCCTFLIKVTLCVICFLNIFCYFIVYIIFIEKSFSLALLKYTNTLAFQ